MARAAPDKRSPGELHTCSGFGWVKFDSDPQFQSQFLPPVPMVRCIGSRASRQYVAGAVVSPSAGHDSHAARGGGDGGELKDGREPFVQVAKQTRAVACAGQLDMIVPAGGRSPCSFRCDGFSFRVEEADARARGVAPRRSGDAQPLPLEGRAPTQSGEPARGSVLPSAAEQGAGVLSSSLRGVEVIAVRMGEILLSMRNTACDAAAAQSTAMDTADAARRICLQAGRITMRSAEQIGAVATWPWRLGGGEGGSE